MLIDSDELKKKLQDMNDKRVEKIGKDTAQRVGYQAAIIELLDWLLAKEQS